MKRVDALVTDLVQLGGDPERCAAVAGLRYVTEGDWIRRTRAGKGYRYVGPNGRPLSTAADLKRVRSLAIPPAWTAVLICPRPDGHIQATGRDARGRKQYRYHGLWRALRDETKFGRMVAFGEALPSVRARVATDLALPGLPRVKVLAALVQLLARTHIRVGNEEYARKNDSFGLTTLRDEHVDVDGPTIHFHFRGKSGKRHRIDLKDRRLARILQRCQDLPGQELFQYVDDDGQPHVIESSDVNSYLRLAAGQEFSAKDFRTWSGTLLAARALRRKGAEAPTPKGVAEAVALVAERLGNTASVCRKSYVHPAVIARYLRGELAQGYPSPTAVSEGGLDPEERALLTLLKEELVALDTGLESSLAAVVVSGRQAARVVRPRRRAA